MPSSPTPRKRRKPPSYRRHSSGQAFVEIRGRRYYLGTHDTDESWAAYKRKLDELWMKPPEPAPETGLTPAQVDRLTIIDLLLQYRPFAEQHYTKNGRPTGTFANLAPAMRRLREMYGETLARQFGPLKFQTLRQTWIDEGKAIKTVNEYAAAVKRVFRWGVKNELIPPSVFEGLRAVEGVAPGRSKARETKPILPVEDDVIDATLPHLPPIVADMVRLQRIFGCRPAEICIMRRCDVERAGQLPSKRDKARPLLEPPVWEYRPMEHKTQHLGHDKVIFIGPRAQMILRPYLVGDADGYCFSPAESERRRREELHSQRQTPLLFGNRPGTNQKSAPKRRPGQRYTTGSYRHAIHRACEVAFNMPEPLRDSAIQRAKRTLPAAEVAELLKQAAAWRDEHCWSPNQIRHTTATDIRARYGLEASSVALGHKHMNTTEIYAQADREKAAAIAREVG